MFGQGVYGVESFIKVDQYVGMLYNFFLICFVLGIMIFKIDRLLKYKKGEL